MEFSRSYIMFSYHNRLKGEAENPAVSIKSDKKEICKDVKQCHSHPFLLENRELFFVNMLYFVIMQLAYYFQINKYKFKIFLSFNFYIVNINRYNISKAFWGPVIIFKSVKEF